MQNVYCKPSYASNLVRHLGVKIPMKFVLMYVDVIFALHFRLSVKDRATFVKKSTFFPKTLEVSEHIFVNSEELT